MLRTRAGRYHSRSGDTCLNLWRVSSRLSFGDKVLLQYVLRALDRWVLRVRYGLQQPLPALSGVLGRPAAVVYMCIHELDIEFALSQPTEAASAARVYLIDTDHSIIPRADFTVRRHTADQTRAHLAKGWVLSQNVAVSPDATSHHRNNI